MSLSKNTFLLPDQQSDVGTWLSMLLSPLNRVRAVWTNRRNRANELRELYRFSDRELWDIGLSRSDIMSIQQGIYRRD